ncbi:MULTISPECIES: hypothetical protein [unclassified Streptomyces]|uniref:hypothetical protein n=1 Tax=unclassified Streptomyces TaxID=2593676 RepID=UPI0033A09A54
MPSDILTGVAAAPDECATHPAHVVPRRRPGPWPTALPNGEVPLFTVDLSCQAIATTSLLPEPGSVPGVADVGFVNEPGAVCRTPGVALAFMDDFRGDGQGVPGEPPDRPGCEHCRASGSAGP